MSMAEICSVMEPGEAVPLHEIRRRVLEKYPDTPWESVGVFVRRAAKSRYLRRVDAGVYALEED